MGSEMSVEISISEDVLSKEIISKLVPNEKIVLDVKAKKVKLNIGDQEKSFNIANIFNITKDGEYYIELVKAKLRCSNNKYDGLIIQLYLSKTKRNLDCKIYNVGGYKDEVPYKYLTSNDIYKQLYDLSICNTEKIVNNNKIKSKEYSGKRLYQQKYEYDRDLIKNYFQFLKEEYSIYEKSNEKITSDDFNNEDSYIKRLNDRFNCMNDNFESLLRHKYSLKNFYFEYNSEEEILIELADAEYDYKKVYCDRGWTGDLADAEYSLCIRQTDKLLYYMTYINMHTLNGVIFSDDELNIKEIECYAKVDALGQYVCIDNEQSLNYFKEKYNINDKDFKIGKYVIIGPKLLEGFTRKYLNEYITGILATQNKEDAIATYENFYKEMCEKLTKLTFLHELGHMAFTGSKRSAKRESDESAANWFASIGLSIVEKYRIYLKTRMQPDEYKNFFTNTALLPGGKLFENKKELEDALKVFQKKIDDDLIKYKDECNYEYYKKVRDMLDDMYN